MLDLCDSVAKMEEGILQLVDADDVSIESKKDWKRSWQHATNRWKSVDTLVHVPGDMLPISKEPAEETHPAQTKTVSEQLRMLFWQMVAAVGGGCMLASLCGSMFFECCVIEAGVILLAAWSDESSDGSSISTNTLLLYNGLYLGSVLLEIVADTIRQSLFVVGTSASTDALHSKLLDTVGAAPLVSFSESTVASLSRMFSVSVGLFDTGFMSTAEYLLNSVFWSIAITTAVSVYVPYFLVAVALMVTAIVLTFKQLPGIYVDLPGLIARCSTQVQDHFSDACAGKAVLQAFSQTEASIAQYDLLCDETAENSHTHMCCQCWLELRASLVGSMGYCLLATMILFMMTSISAGTAGFLIVNAAFLSFICVMVLENAIQMYDLLYHRNECTAYIEHSEEVAESNTLACPANETIAPDWPQKVVCICR